jgi:DNA-directed RNA polymerase specialized sigma subunit
MATRQPTRLSPEQRRFAAEHLGLARQQAHRYARRWSMPIDDLLGPAYEGLCKGAAQFDPAKGFRPSSYLVSKVKGELLHHLRDTGFAVRISHRYRELWIKARRWLELDLSDEEIAIRLGISLEDWLDCRQACGQRPLSLGTLWGL